MDAFLHFGKFESLVRKISEFEESYPTSVRTAQAQEYRLAGLFEKGRKIARDAFRATDDSGFNSHWSVAETNLQQFLALAVSRANYTELPGRSLREDVWVARILLGDEALFEEVQDRAGREKLSLLRLELAVDLERESVDTNLRRLVDFLDEFPEPAERERLERAAAVLYFRKGRQLAMNGELALARDYFEAQRAIADRDAAMLEDRFYSHLLEGDFRTLESLTAAAIEQSEPGGVEWIQAKLFDAFGSLNQTRTNEAAAVLDELIVAAETFKDDKPHDRLLINAVKWRIHLALSGGDPARAESLARWVQRSDCPKHYKLPFLRDHVGLLPTQPWEGGAR
jgi:hypothetical protein